MMISYFYKNQLKDRDLFQDLYRIINMTLNQKMKRNFNLKNNQQPINHLHNKKNQKVTKNLQQKNKMKSCQEISFSLRKLCAFFQDNLSLSNLDSS